MEREIAKVERADLGFEDHGMFGFNIAFVFRGGGQGTGWYILSTAKEATGCDFLARIMRSFAVERWQHIVGRTVWIERGENGIVAWENLPTEQGFRFVIADELKRS